MRISEMKDIIKENFRHQKNPLFFHGSPGIGKTDGIEDAVREIAAEDKKKLVLRTIILSQFESVDLRGLPSVSDEVTKWNPPEDLTFDKDAEGIVFFDEMSNAAADVQKAAQQIIHARRLGELRIPDGIVFIAAGNRQEDRAGANRLLTALGNRFEHHDIVSDHEDWVKWAMKSGIEHTLISFIHWKPSSLNDFKSDRYINPTPRTWVKVNHLMDSKHFDERVRGVVGPGAGDEFIAYCRIWRELPDCEQIWKNPDKVAMPTKQDIVYATAMSLALKATSDNFANALKYMKKAGKEMQVLFVRMACQVTREVKETKEFNDYLKENKGLMFG
jgi:hypothetical protein